MSAATKKKVGRPLTADPMVFALNIRIRKTQHATITQYVKDLNKARAKAKLVPISVSDWAREVLLGEITDAT